jgi:hypothetical protein
MPLLLVTVVMVLLVVTVVLKVVELSSFLLLVSVLPVLPSELASCMFLWL